MKPFICIALALAIFSNPSFAGPGTPSNIIFPADFTNTLKVFRHLFEPAVPKVCACQILRVESKNEEENFIAVFAQAVNTGDINGNLAAANSVLEKEKKHLKNLFYTKIQMAGNIGTATECSLLYKNIQAQYSQVKMYDVLDADALNDRKVVSNKF